MKRSRNIEIANPAAPGQRRGSRRCTQSSHAVTGSQKTTANGRNG
jgi:hypothetical protein